MLWGLVEFFLSSSTWFLIVMAGIIAKSAKMYRRAGYGINPWVIAWSFVTFIIIIIVLILFVIAMNVIVNNWLRRPSSVDISPLANLSAEQLERVEEAILQLAGEGYINISNATESPNSRTLSGRWVIDSPRLGGYRTGMHISISIRRDDEQAGSSLRSAMRSNPEHHTHIINDNNTEAVLMYPWMPVSASGWHIPTDMREFISEVRINNITIRLWENRHWADFDKNYSNQFIHALAEALQ